MTKLEELGQFGQSIWLDYIRRSLINDGELEDLISKGVRGITSNPTILEKAIAGSTDYDQDLYSLVIAGKPVPDIYEALVLEDIRHAADLLRPVYNNSNAVDGYVSLEVNPELAQDTEGTVAEARRLFRTLNRPNIMIKIPATPAGIPAIEAAISEGININVTLIFSQSHYEGAAQAYLNGLEKYAASGGDLTRIASVASFFISRIDTAVDRDLETAGEISLQGKIAIASAKIAYTRFKEIFESERWGKLADQGARPQRPLWASTSTKNPAYSDTHYVDNLIGPHTVNTVPPETLQAFLDHGRVAPTLERGVDTSYQQMSRLNELDINLNTITNRLQDHGVNAFTDSFNALLNSIAEKRQNLLSAHKPLSYQLGIYQTSFEAALSQLQSEQIIDRIWSADYTVWKPNPSEVTNRLGWLDIAIRMKDALPGIKKVVEEIQDEGYTHVRLLGMGGSSLAPEVFEKTFGTRDGYLEMAVVDSTDPGAILDHLNQLDLGRTLFIVSTKSGGTVETLSLFKFYYQQVLQAVGDQQAGAHFIAITDLGSRLAELAEQYEFRHTFLNDPNIGGRYAALSYFGLVPACLIGMDVDKLLDRSMEMTHNCQNRDTAAGDDNPCVQLGAILGTLANAGRDKLTLITSPSLSSFADWVEQLVAESTGKEGKGILPVVGEVLGSPTIYGSDRLFVFLTLVGDHNHDTSIQALADSGHLIVRFHLQETYNLGGQFFLWEMASAIAGYFLGINPFDQPDVESAKIQARKMVKAYQQQGVLPTGTPALKVGEFTVFGNVQSNTPEDALKDFISQGHKGSYIALQAYLQPSNSTDAALLDLRTKIRDKTRLAVTSGYGPRFLHSTGQLHKGDAGDGLFIQFTYQNTQDIPIPDQANTTDSSISFGVLKMAQALGDQQALLAAGRKVIRFDLGTDFLAGLERLSKSL